MAKIIDNGDKKRIYFVKKQIFLNRNPSDILYIESVSNYVNIVYFSGQDLLQKRLLFGSDKVLPVSKANVPAFKERVLNRQDKDQSMSGTLECPRRPVAGRGLVSGCHE